MKILPSWNRSIYLVALILIVQPALAGKITGRLLLNGSPVEFAQISFRTSTSSSTTWFGTSRAEGVFNSDSNLPTGTFAAATYADAVLRSDYLVPYRIGIGVINGQTTNIGDVEVLPANRSISGSVGGTANPAIIQITSTANIAGIEYRVWSTPNESTRAFTLPAVDGTWTIVAMSGTTPVGEAVVTVQGSNVTNVQLNAAPLSAYTTWAYSYGLFGSQVDLGANPDGDSFPNSVEFAFGTNPSIPNATLTASTRSGNQLTVSWLERNDAVLGYFVRQSTDLKIWEGANVTVQNGSASPAPPAGYTRKQFTVTAAGRNFFRVLATDTPAAVPNQSFTISVAGQPVNVERWGTGPKAVIMFGYIPFTMQQDLKESSGSTFSSLVGSDYSMFLWTYPEVGPFALADSQIDAYFANPVAALENRLDFTGYASSVVSQIRAVTGLTDVCVVGNSFGAGVVMWDLAALSTDPKVRFVLISPTEVFMPYLNLLPAADPLPRTSLISDAFEDFFIYSQGAYEYLELRATGLPPGYISGEDYPHFIIGFEPTRLAYVFSLINALYQQP
jgi:hypothetical protein